MKKGYYTTINGNEYKIETTPAPNPETIIITYDKEGADESFKYDEDYGGYIKVVDRASIVDVYRYDISYMYKGYKVAKLGEKEDKMTISLDYNAKELAKKFDFKQLDQVTYYKEVNISEVEMKQEGPYNSATWR